MEGVGEVLPAPSLRFPAAMLIYTDVDDILKKQKHRNGVDSATHLPGEDFSGRILPAR